MEILQILIFGLVLGSIYALGAVGASLTFGVLRFANLAHGDLMTWGAFVALSGVAAGAPLWASAIVGMAAAAALAVLVDRVVFRRLRGRDAVVLLFSSFGIGLMIRSLVQIFWGPGTEVYAAGIQLPWKIGDLRIKPDHVTIILAALGAMTAIHLFLTRTRMGKAMRAVSDNPALARTVGVDPERVALWVWVIGGAAAALAGVLIGMDTRLHNSMGYRLLLPILAAAILGGIGSPYGAMVGGLVVGIAEEASTLFISAEYRHAVAFAILVMMLIWRPTGLFGKR